MQQRARHTITAALLPFLALHTACDSHPMSSTEPIGTSAAQVPGANSAGDGLSADIADGEAEPFDVAEVFFEFNTTDNDLGFQIFLDAEGWQRLSLADPARRNTVEINARGALSELGITELRFESAEPSPAEVLALFPPGPYRFTGMTVEGQRLASTARLSHRFLPAPTFSPSGGETVDRNATVVRWHAPGARQIEILAIAENGNRTIAESTFITLQ